MERKINAPERVLVQNSVVLSHQQPIEIVDEVTKQKVKDLQNQYDMATNPNAGKKIVSHLNYFSVSALVCIISNIRVKMRD